MSAPAIGSQPAEATARLDSWPERRSPSHSTAPSDGAWDLGRIPRSFVEVFVTGSSHGVRQAADPIVARFPWAVLAPTGAYALIRQRHRLRGVYLVALANSAMAVLIYCSFRAVVGAQVKFENIHYSKAWFPLWALLAAEAVAAATSMISVRRIGAS